MNNTFIGYLEEHNRLFLDLHLLANDVESAVELIANAIKSGGKILLCGNGGSAADSQHIAAEFTGRFIQDRKPLPALALSTDTSALTCISNDYSFNEVFARQVQAFFTPKDCLIAISTSGNSENVIQAVLAAKSLGGTSIGLLGRDGGKLLAICDHSIVVPSKTTGRIQEAHILIGHAICGGVEKQLGLV